MLVLKTQICSSGTDIKWNDLCIMQISCLLSMASSEGNTHLVESNFEATHNTHTCTHLKAVMHISVHCLYVKPHQRKGVNSPPQSKPVYCSLCELLGHLMCGKSCHHLY